MHLPYCLTINASFVKDNTLISILGDIHLGCIEKYQYCGYHSNIRFITLQISSPDNKHHTSLYMPISHLNCIHYRKTIWSTYICGNWKLVFGSTAYHNYYYYEQFIQQQIKALGLKLDKIENYYTEERRIAYNSTDLKLNLTKPLRILQLLLCFTCRSQLVNILKSR